jgi:hypothetical protein
MRSGFWPFSGEPKTVCNETCRAILFTGHPVETIGYLYWTYLRAEGMQR